MTRSETWALWAAIGVVVWWIVLPWLLPADELVYGWLQFNWGESAHRATLWIDLAVRLTLGALVGTCALAIVRIRVIALFETAALVVGGAIVNEFLKTAVERLRPESVPIMSTGNSFPSGHVMNTTLFALAAGHLVVLATRASGIRRIVYAVAGACIVAQAVCRLGLEAHWLSDLPVSVLLAVAWFHGAPALRRLPLWGITAVAAAFAISFLVFYREPATRFRLPSAMDDQGAPAASVEFGTPSASSALIGSWRNGPPEPIGPVGWLLEREASIRVSETTGRARVLKLTARPQSCGKSNLHVNPRLVVSVNGWSFPAFRLRRGWREYHLELPSGVLRDGVNSVSFRVEGPRIDCPGEGDPGFAAFRYFRIYAADPAAAPSG